MKENEGIMYKYEEIMKKYETNLKEYELGIVLSPKASIEGVSSEFFEVQKPL